MLALETVTAAHFEACLHQTFRLLVKPEPIALELIAIRSLGPAREPGGRAPFALEFKLPGAAHCPQQIFRLENEKVGEMEIFLVQIAPDRLEAIFN